MNIKKKKVQKRNAMRAIAAYLESLRHGRILCFE